jgi:AcrR family transcriptional regulator
MTMRRLAEELGVGTMTLYGYFRSKDELIDVVVDTATEEPRVMPGAGPWKDQLRELFQGVRETLLKHPSGVRLRLARPMLSPGALRVTETGMEILTRAGFGKADAARAYRTLFIYTFGFVAFGSPEAPDETKRFTRAAVMALPPEEYPVLTSAAREAAEAMAGDEQFGFGLDRLLDGLEARLQSSRGGRRARDH